MGHGNGGWMNSDQRQATEARPAVNKGAEGRYEWTARTAAANEEPGTWAATEAGLWLNDELLGFPEPAREILRLAGFKAVLELVALALGCLPTEFPDAYGHLLDAANELLPKERRACAELVREAAKVEREVAATWEQEAREVAPGADALHLKACSAIALGHVGFAERLEDLANEIKRRGEG